MPHPPPHHHQHALHASLNIDEPFDACILAMVLCAFWGMMHFGEVSVTSRGAFDMVKHLTRKDAHFGFDLDGKPYAHLDLVMNEHFFIFHLSITIKGLSKKRMELGHRTKNEVTMWMQHHTAPHSIVPPCSTFT